MTTARRLVSRRARDLALALLPAALLAGAVAAGRMMPLVPPAYAISSTVVISEVDADTPLSGTDTDNEWIELRNVSAGTITLENWTVTDNVSSDVIPTVTLGPGGHVIVAATAGGFASEHPAFAGTVLVIADGAIGNGLANGGDRLILRDGNGVEVDGLSWGSNTTVLSPAPGADGPANTNQRDASGTDTDTAADWTRATETPNGDTSGTPTPSPTPSPTPTPTPTPLPTPTPTPIPPPPTNVRINEMDADTPGSDLAEFVELYDGGAGHTPLDGLVVVFYNGSNDLSYAAFDLDGAVTNADGYYTLGNAAVPGVDHVFPGNLLQNGADAVALYHASASDFPNSTPVAFDHLVDAIVYDTSDADDPGLLVLLNPGQPQVDENSASTGDTVSSQRCPDGLGGARNTSRYRQFPPTPDGSNVCGGEVEELAIPQIQGEGPLSPKIGRSVVTTGIVTARKQAFSGGTYRTNGFFLQSNVPAPGDPDSDGRPASSEGLFVFTGVVPAVQVGDVVTVSGIVSEFFDLTQVTAVNDDIVVLSSAQPLPSPVVLTPAVLDAEGTVGQLERLEGMRVHAASLTTTAPTNNFGEIWTVLTGVERPFREQGLEASRALPPGSPCCVPRFDENPERLMVDSDGVEGTASLVVTSGVTLAALTGPLDFTFDDYKVVPETAPSATHGLDPVPVPMPAADELTIASANLENFFATAVDFPARLEKASRVVRGVMRSPDIIGVEEIGDLATLQALAGRLNADTVAAGGADPGYVAYLEEADDDTDQDIDVGFLVKTARVEVLSVIQEGKGVPQVDPVTGLPLLDDMGLPVPLNDRTPLVLRVNASAPGGPAVPVTVIVNHLRSLIDIEQDPGDGPRVREKRRQQAEFLAGLVQARQDENLVVIGDFNAFQFSDGYVDGIGTIKGTPTPEDQVVLASDDLVNPDLTNLIDTALVAADQRYSYVFGGNAQALDHVLVDGEMLARATGLAFGRANADFPLAHRGDPTRPERLSDHDPAVARFVLPGATATVVVSAPNPSGFGELVTLTATVTAGGQPVTEGSVRFEDGGTLLGRVEVGASGQATLVTSGLAVGSHLLIAAYQGTVRHAASQGETTQVVAPGLTVNDVSVSEGTLVSTARFTVRLFPPAAEAVTVGFATADGTARAWADYLPRSGEVTFAPGETTRTVTVLVVGDLRHELDETFVLNLSGAAGDAQGEATIVNNDPPPALSITDVKVSEGRRGATATFVVSLSYFSGLPVTVDFATADGTATAPDDYEARSGTLTFAPGSLFQTVSVAVRSDSRREGTERFFVNLSGAAGATIGDGTGVGTIVEGERD